MSKKRTFCDRLNIPNAPRSSSSLLYRVALKRLLTQNEQRIWTEWFDSTTLSYLFFSVDSLRALGWFFLFTRPHIFDPKHCKHLNNRLELVQFMPCWYFWHLRSSLFAEWFHEFFVELQKPWFFIDFHREFMLLQISVFFRVHKNFIELIDMNFIHFLINKFNLNVQLCA